MGDIISVSELSVTGVYVDKTNGRMGLNVAAPTTTLDVSVTEALGSTQPVVRIKNGSSTGMNYCALEIADAGCATGMTTIGFSTMTAGMIGVPVSTDHSGGLVVSGLTGSASTVALKIEGIGYGDTAVSAVVIDFAQKNGTGKTNLAAGNKGLRITNNGGECLSIYGDASVKLYGKFACNNATPQESISCIAPPAYVAGANGLDSGANMSALVECVASMRGALIDYGILKVP
jgi:hypothetical protein